MKTRTSLVWLLAFAIGAVSQTANGQSTCGNANAGDCCASNGTPGCDDSACCEAVCACDPFCCDVQWDVYCATHGLGADCLCSPAPSSCGALNTPECDFCWQCPACDEPLCPGDLTGSENVGVPDLLEMLGAWGACDDGCPGCPGDLTCSGSVGVPDLLELLANWGECPVQVCGPDAGSCCAANPSAGCDNAECCEAVCAIDPTCCEDGWFFACVVLASELCESCGCGLPEAGSCCAANPSIGCDNAECCEAVCACDPFCCEVQWDSFCASQGFDPDCLCGPGQCGAWKKAECSYCIDDACAAASGPKGTDCCTIQPQGTGGCEVESCCQCVCSKFPGCCLGGSGGTGTWSATCVNHALTTCADECPCAKDQEPCGPDAGSCFEVNGSPGCDDPVCCEAICAADPFCCDVTWDQLCADQAMVSPDCIHVDFICTEVAGIPGTDCCVAHGGVGCIDFRCCEAICGFDPFCCDVMWDEICAEHAQQSEACDCADPCGPDAGPCFFANGTPGCDEPECCAAVCADDPFCCDVMWDEICAFLALENPACSWHGDPVCAEMAGAPGAECCDAHGGVGCNQFACCECICDLDPFCCDVAWDEICAGFWIAQCPCDCAAQQP